MLSVNLKSVDSNVKCHLPVAKLSDHCVDQSETSFIHKLTDRSSKELNDKDKGTDPKIGEIAKLSQAQAQLGQNSNSLSRIESVETLPFLLKCDPTMEGRKGNIICQAQPAENLICTVNTVDSETNCQTQPNVMGCD